MLTIVPIFWEQELIGWAAGVTHEIDIGAKTPGSVPVGPINRYEDGIDIPARKIGADDRLFKDHVRRACADANADVLDARRAHPRGRVPHGPRGGRAVILEEGIDTYKQFIREVLEEGRRSFRSRLMEMTVPGRYRAVAFTEVPFAAEQQLPSYARIDTLMHAPTELRTTRDGVLEFDYDGSSSWGYHSMNCTPSAMQGAIWVQLTQTLIPNEKINDGAYMGLRANFPPGTWTNHSNPAASTGIAWWFLIPSFTGFIKSLSRGLQARGFVEEVLAPYPFTSNVFQGGGIDHFGQPSATTNFGLSCCGGGAKMVLDGLDYGAAMWNPEGDMGDMEMWEIIEPFLYLGQRVKASTGGMGRRRGGSGYETLRLAWKTPFYEMQNIDHSRLHCHSGLWGGYPGSAGYRHNVRDTNMFELIAAQEPYPTHDGNPEESNVERLVTGRRDFDQHTLTLPELMQQGDLYVCVYHGGDGLGDPLDRNPEHVEEDLNDGFLLPRFAESVYGAVTESGDDGRWSVDHEATEKRRAEAREQRRAKAVPVREWMTGQRERILAHTNGGGDFGPHIQRMYAESMRLSERWAAEFRGVLGLPADFDFPVPTPTVDISKAMLARASLEGWAMRVDKQMLGTSSTSASTAIRSRRSSRVTRTRPASTRTSSCSRSARPGRTGSCCRTASTCASSPGATGAT